MGLTPAEMRVSALFLFKHASRWRSLRCHGLTPIFGGHNVLDKALCIQGERVGTKKEIIQESNK
jgi:hypothetical protein